MPNIQVFTCPTCGGSLVGQGDQIEVTCQFCGNTVIVPPELRLKSAARSALRPLPVFKRTSIVLLLVVFGLLSFLCTSFCGTLYLWGILSTSSQTFIPTPTPAYTAIALAAPDDSMLQNANGVTVDSAGNIYVVVGSTGAIHQFSASGDYLTQIKTEGQAPVPAISADAAGNLYVVQQGAILKYKAATQGLLDRFKGIDQFEDVAVLPDGNLVAYSTANGDDLVYLDPSGVETNRVHDALSALTGRTEQAVRLAVDEEGVTYVLSIAPSRFVYKFAPGGEFLMQFGGPDQLAAPQAIAADRYGQVYVSDFLGIQVFNSNGQYLRTLPLPQYTSPLGLFISAQNELFAIGDDYGITHVVAKYALP
jgi:DNA-binding beta-propeller fold protein YncE